MSAPMVTGAAALLLQAQPKMTEEQLKFVLQSGSTYMVGAGVFAAGAGNVNFWTTRQMQADANLLTSLLNIVNSLTNLLLDRSGGVSFFDNGTTRLQDNLYNGVGIHLLSLLDLPGIILNPLQLQQGKLNLVGLTNAISVLPAKRILYGDVSYWTVNDHIIWGDDITSPEGEHIIWGDTDLSDDYHIIWGDSTTGDPDTHK